MNMDIYKRYMPIFFGVVIIFFWALFSYGRWYTYNEMFITFKGSYDWQIGLIDASDEGVLRLNIDQGDHRATISMFPKGFQSTLLNGARIENKEPISAGHRTGERFVIRRTPASVEEIMYRFNYKEYEYFFSGDEKITKIIIKNIVWK